MNNSNSVNSDNCDCENITAAEKERPRASLKQTREQVDELIEISRENVNKIIERDHKLSDLKDISESLEKGAAEFKTSTTAIKRKEWRKHVKTKLILVGILSILIIITIFILVQTFVVK